jgi:hypothetical protein
MFCPPGLLFGDTEGVPSRFHVFRSQTCFRRYRGRRVPFSCFTRPDLFSAVPRVSGPVFIFYTLGIIFGGDRGRPNPFSSLGFVFGGTKGFRSRCHVLRSRTRFRWYRGRRVPFSCIVPPESFSTVTRVSGLVFMFCSPGLVFDGTEGIGSLFHVLRSRTRFRRYRVRKVPLCYLPLPDSFSAVPTALGPVFMFCAPQLIFGGTERVGSHFHVLSVRTRFRQYRGIGFHFHVFPVRTHLRRFQGRPIPF